MLELRIVAEGHAMPIFDLPAALGRQKAAREVSDTIEGLITFLDDLGDDPDLEDNGDDEPAGDETDMAYVEWHTKGGRHGVAETIGEHEDAEDDDPAEEDDDSGQCDEDGVNTAFDKIRYTVGGSGPGCPISDEGEESDTDSCSAQDDAGTDQHARGKIGFDGPDAIMDDGAEEDDHSDEHDGCEPEEGAFAPIADRAAYFEHRGRIRRDRCWKGRWGNLHLYVDPVVPTARNIIRRKRGMPRYVRA